VKWTLKAMPTSTGRAALAEEAGEGGRRRRFLRIEGAWDTQVYQWLPASSGLDYLASARLRGRVSPGGDSALYLTILSGSGSVLRGSMQALKKGETPDWQTQALCERAPEGARWVGGGVGSSRQGADDWMEVDSIEIRAAGPAAAP